MTGISLAVGVGLLCALLSALGTNLAFLLKYKGAVAAPDVDMRHPLRSAADLFRSRWWTIGWCVAVVAFLLHVAALTLAPLSVGQAVLAGGLVFLAVLAERFFGFALGRRQWIGIGLVAVSLSLLTLTGGTGGGGARSGYSPVGLIVFEAIAIGLGIALVVSHQIDRIPAQRGVLLGVAAGLGFGISDVAIKALSGDLDDGVAGLISPWSVIIVSAAVFSFYASARSLQIGEGVTVIAVTSVAANLSTIVAGLAVFGDRLPQDLVDPRGEVVLHGVLKRLAHAQHELAIAMADEGALALGERVLQDDGDEIVVDVGAGLGRSAAGVLARQANHHVGDSRCLRAGGRRVDAGHASLLSRPPPGNGLARNEEGRRSIRSRGPRSPVVPVLQARLKHACPSR